MTKAIQSAAQSDKTAENKLKLMQHTQQKYSTVHWPS